MFSADNIPLEGWDLTSKIEGEMAPTAFLIKERVLAGPVTCTVSVQRMFLMQEMLAEME
jgi:hypothetical protein